MANEKPDYEIEIMVKEEKILDIYFPIYLELNGAFIKITEEEIRSIFISETFIDLTILEVTEKTIKDKIEGKEVKVISENEYNKNYELFIEKTGINKL